MLPFRMGAEVDEEAEVTDAGDGVPGKIPH